MTVDKSNLNHSLEQTKRAESTYVTLPEERFTDKEIHLKLVENGTEEGSLILLYKQSPNSPENHIVLEEVFTSDYNVTDEGNFVITNYIY